MSTVTVSTTKAKRPSSITLISVFAVVGGIDLLYYVLSPGIQNFVQAHGIGETLSLSFGGIVVLISGIGFWFMKKWAVYTFIACAILSQIQLILIGRWDVFSILIAAIPIFVGFKHLSKMT